MSFSQKQHKENLEKWASSKYAAFEKGVIWYLYGDQYALSKNERGDPPWIGSSAFMNAGQRLKNGNTMICDFAANCVYEVTRDHDVVWSFGEFGVSGSDDEHLYHPHFVSVDEDAGKVLIADSVNDRVLEVDYETKDVLHELTSIDSGDIQDPHSVCYTPQGNIMVALLGNHYIVEVDWAGNEVWSWGTWNTSGHTENPERLNNPTAAFPYPPRRDEYAVISDYRNDRALWVLEDGTVDYKVVAPSPECVEPGNDLRVGVGCTRDFCFALNRLGALETYVPWESSYFEPTIDGTYLIGGEDVREIDPRYFPSRMNLRSRTLLDSYSLGANTSVGPIYSGANNIEQDQVVLTFPFDKVTFMIKSTQSADYEPLVARTSTPFDSTGLRFADWMALPSKSLTAGEWETYTPTYKAPMMGLRITMGGTDGNVTVHVSGE